MIDDELFKRALAEFEAKVFLFSSFLPGALGPPTFAQASAKQQGPVSGTKDSTWGTQAWTENRHEDKWQSWSWSQGHKRAKHGH